MATAERRIGTLNVPMNSGLAPLTVNIEDREADLRQSEKEDQPFEANLDAETAAQLAPVIDNANELAAGELAVKVKYATNARLCDKSDIRFFLATGASF